jgi:hypothetical protein
VLGASPRIFCFGAFPKAGDHSFRTDVSFRSGLTATSKEVILEVVLNRLSKYLAFAKEAKKW